MTCMTFDFDFFRHDYVIVVFLIIGVQHWVPIGRKINFLERSL
jgi:hypothetical protein